YKAHNKRKACGNTWESAALRFGTLPGRSTLFTNPQTQSQQARECSIPKHIKIVVVMNAVEPWKAQQPPPFQWRSVYDTKWRTVGIGENVRLCADVALLIQNSSTALNKISAQSPTLLHSGRMRGIERTTVTIRREERSSAQLQLSSRNFRSAKIRTR
ncbi:MAG: hypothetical protein WAN62_18260, partial [Candidatus Acidiferrum sp.]